MALAVLFDKYEHMNGNRLNQLTNYWERLGGGG